MEGLDPTAIVARLVAAGMAPDRAAQYCDAFVEYRTAQANITEHGAIVQHPRTGNPIENPYLTIRDRALVKLRRLRAPAVMELW